MCNIRGKSAHGADTRKKETGQRVFHVKHLGARRTRERFGAIRSAGEAGSSAQREGRAVGGAKHARSVRLTMRRTRGRGAKTVRLGTRGGARGSECSTGRGGGGLCLDE